MSIRLLVGLLFFIAGLLIAIWGVHSTRRAYRRKSHFGRATPRTRGLVHRGRLLERCPDIQSLSRRDRSRVEAMLRLLFEHALDGQELSARTVAEQLGYSLKRTVALGDILRRQGLLDADSWTLTSNGESCAVYVIRKHRLLETYLSERSGIPPEQWHFEAQRQATRDNPEEPEWIARQLGFPRYDPHGDPIPSEFGDIPPVKGEPLGILRTPPGLYEITHMEDEPPEIYQELLDMGLFPGAIIEVESQDAPSHEPSGSTKASKPHPADSRRPAYYLPLRFEDRHYQLSPLQARQLTVRPTEEKPEDQITRLSMLTINRTAEVVGISGACRGPNRRRLLDLGFVRGSKVRIDLVSPLGNPTAYLIRGTSIALRRDQAFQIQVRLIPQSQSQQTPE
ncbi:MAG: hypothetical protein AL399_07410 [Candidatus [Bacteroides] periocalifornicus]|uniref:Ferrous iron transporter FeoA-like domain-containing protein n=1 Tax=Candidatus [Bacteroides] periocalifornicus TaxID=1702214 RepID=A0A0Q4AX06_9BACT|nr:MAG: hypothetical protein AL399_07410 [Candidatus [Bacteroides] periocalifornicus]